MVRECIKEVVWGEHGTARLVRDDRVMVVGKTGTAYPVEGRVYNKSKRRYAFCGFFPYEEPQYSCMALILGPSGNSANRTSGQVVKNMAIKMYSRGMLHNVSTYTAEKSGDSPIVSATTEKSNRTLKRTIGDQKIRCVKAARPGDMQSVPDLKGYDAPSAVRLLEERGINARVTGAGQVVSQSVAPGTKVARGSIVKLTLRI
jgi:cell division protein FtsI (penicillin-binding protein 3)